jgi:hypothetical protein
MSEIFMMKSETYVTTSILCLTNFINCVKIETKFPLCGLQIEEAMRSLTLLTFTIKIKQQDAQYFGGYICI